MNSNKSLIVHICKSAHDELAVKSVGDSTVTLNRVAEILDMESALDAGCEETPEWSDQRGECRKEEDVELEGFDIDGSGYAGPSGEFDR